MLPGMTTWDHERVLSFNFEYLWKKAHQFWQRAHQFVTALFQRCCNERNIVKISKKASWSRLPGMNTWDHEIILYSNFEYLWKKAH